MALACFKKWDGLTHDSANKGWNGASSTGKTEPPKSQDSAIHILEALVELWQTFPTDTFVKCAPCCLESSQNAGWLCAAGRLGGWAAVQYMGGASTR